MPEPAKLASLLDRWILPVATSLTLRERLDILDRAVEWLRIETGHARNQLEMDEFLRSYREVRDGALHFAPAPPSTARDTGTPPLQLQPRLLLYLLLYHKQRTQPLEVIDGFISKMLPYLRPVDFVRTKTGVTRCYTNTRFAANVLRAYGFLRYTQRERYKAWILTLPGIVAAAHALVTDGWRITDARKDAGMDLHKGIRESLRVVEDYGHFVQTLQQLIGTETEIFASFEPALKEAHHLLREFHRWAADTGVSKADRQEKCHELMEHLDQRLGDQFYEDFTAAMQIESLLKTVESHSKGP